MKLVFDILNEFINNINGFKVKFLNDSNLISECFLLNNFLSSFGSILFKFFWQQNVKNNNVIFDGVYKGKIKDNEMEDNERMFLII